MNRRELLLCLTSGLISGSSLCAWAQPGTVPKSSQPPAGGGFEPPPSGKGSGGASKGFKGCALYGNDAKVFFDQLGPRLRPSSGITYLDSVMPIEGRILSQMFGVNPGFCFLADAEASNALASPLSYFPPGRGTVAFGIRLIREEAKGGDFNSITSALVGIMAHEWGHILSFDAGVQAQGKAMELLADCMAGWYIGWKVGNGMRTVNPRAFADSVFNKGDYAFNSPSHHGTPKERFDHVTEGFNMYLRDRILSSQAAFQTARRLVKL